jgi:sphingomyelin phosphodiesterase 2
MGDFNSIPTSLPVTIIKEHTLLEDAWPSSHDTAFFRPPGVVHNAQHAIHGFGVTADSPMNSYTAGKPLDDEARRWQGKRLDYIFFRKPAPSRRKLFHQRHHQLVNGTEDTDSFTPSLVCKETKVVLTSKVPGFPFSYSDHFGVEATLEIRFPSTSSTPQDHLIQDENVIDFTDSPSPSPAEPAAGPSATHATGPVLISDSGLTEQTLTHTLRALANAYTLSRRRARYHLVIFALCLFASIGLAIGSGWQPVTAINPFVALAVLALGWLGTTMLYVGFIFGRWELNALTGIIEELELWGNRQEFENRP